MRRFCVLRGAHVLFPVFSEGFSREHFFVYFLAVFLCIWFTVRGARRVSAESSIRRLRFGEWV